MCQLSGVRIPRIPPPVEFLAACATGDIVGKNWEGRSSRYTISMLGGWGVGARSWLIHTDALLAHLAGTGAADSPQLPAPTSPLNPRQVPPLSCDKGCLSLRLRAVLIPSTSRSPCLLGGCPADLSLQHQTQKKQAHGGCPTTSQLCIMSNPFDKSLQLFL